MKICKESGKLAGQYCPESDIQTQVRIVDALQGSADYAYSVSKSILNETCDVHDENFKPKDDSGEDEEEENPDDEQLDGEEEDETIVDEPEETIE